MSPHIFPIIGCLATSTIIFFFFPENRLSYCSASKSKAHRLDPAARCLLFSCLLKGSGLAPSSHWNPGEPGALLEVTQGPHRAESVIFKDYFNSLYKVKLWSHFKWRSSESHCTTPPADVNRCPTTFNRACYQCGKSPAGTALSNFRSASLSRCCPCCAGTTLLLTC